jgi:hypothetical protein
MMEGETENEEESEITGRVDLLSFALLSSNSIVHDGRGD